MDQRKAFEEAVRTMENIRRAAANGDPEAQRLLALAAANRPAFALADLRKYRPERG